jgi:hypothetical protein
VRVHPSVLTSLSLSYPLLCPSCVCACCCCANLLFPSMMKATWRGTCGDCRSTRHASRGSQCITGSKGKGAVAELLGSGQVRKARRCAAAAVAPVSKQPAQHGTPAPTQATQPQPTAAKGTGLSGAALRRPMQERVHRRGRTKLPFRLCCPVAHVRSARPLLSASSLRCSALLLLCSALCSRSLHRPRNATQRSRTEGGRQDREGTGREG